jgi:hypothetical protein
MRNARRAGLVYNLYVETRTTPFNTLPIVVAAAFVFASAIAVPAFAQGGYIGAFLVSDVVRMNQYDSTLRDSGNGEALGFALRLGSSLGAKWGVELEFVRPGEITTEQSPQILPLLATTPNVSVPSLPGLPVSVYDPLTFPSFSYQFRATQRRTTLSAAVWARQEISRRFSLAYLGGVAFGRTNSEVEISYLPIRPTILPISPAISESVIYDVGPMVGVEGRIRMAGQVDLVPGLRLHAIDGGWMIRPALGLAWAF